MPSPANRSPTRNVSPACGCRVRPRCATTPASRGAFADLRKAEQAGKTVRAVYVHDQIHRIKLLAPLASFAIDNKGQLTAFLQKDAAAAYARANKGQVLDYAALRAGKTTLAAN